MVVVVVILVGAGAGVYEISQASQHTGGASTTCTPTAGIIQSIELNNSTTPDTLRPATDLVFPIPIPNGRLNIKLVGNYTLTNGGPVEMSIYNSTNYTTFQTAFNALDNSTGTSDTGGSSVPVLYTLGETNSGSYNYTGLTQNASFDLVFINRSLQNPLTMVAPVTLTWSLPSC